MTFPPPFRKTEQDVKAELRNSTRAASSSARISPLGCSRIYSAALSTMDFAPDAAFSEAPVALEEAPEDTPALWAALAAA